MLNERSRHKRVHPIWFYLYDDLEHVKLINSDINQISVCLRQRVWGESTIKSHERSFWSDGNVLYHTEVVVTLVFTFVKTHQSTHFKCEHCIVCQLYWEKFDLKIKIEINRNMHPTLQFIRAFHCSVHLLNPYHCFLK